LNGEVRHDLLKGLLVQINRDNNLNLWDCTEKKYDPRKTGSTDREEFVKEGKEELQANISKYQYPNLVLVF
jgi:hypothetical protein